MLIREIFPEEKERFNKATTHPLQSYEWGEFRKKTGLKAVRLGIFNGDTLISSLQFTIHKFPLIGANIGYLPKGPYPNAEILEALMKFGELNNCIFIQLEPNKEKAGNEEDLSKKFHNLKPSTRPLFTKYTFYIDLRKSEEELFAQMKEKTRYNVRLAQKRGVVVREENTMQAFGEYLKLLSQTTRRDKFFAHNKNYHKLMWETLSPEGTARLLIARYNGKPLAAWVLFVWHDFLYYAYGASSSENREVMASNLMYFEAMKFGKKLGLSTFDLWGALGSNPNPKDPFFGFHRFKEGYGGKHIEFMGSYDLILNSPFYQIYQVLDKIRWKFLNLKNKLPPL
jgi:lipid II:glycine glycyltransferase (peptidoglycan interpeptide bridge formation enzyme)